jgi:hypothetical protein
MHEHINIIIFFFVTVCLSSTTIAYSEVALLLLSCSLKVREGLTCEASRLLKRPFWRLALLVA